MFRAVLFAMFASAVACGGTSDTNAPAVVAGATAGKVIEISGKVTATRDGKARDLAKGDPVSGDDLVATAADASVVIELVHNNARWNLGASKSGKVAESAAWALAKAGSAESVEGDSTAAGRHAERSSAETAASAARDREVADQLANAQTDEARKAAIEKLKQMQRADEEKMAAERRAIDGKQTGEKGTRKSETDPKTDPKADNDRKNQQDRDSGGKDDRSGGDKNVKSPDTAVHTDPSSGNMPKDDPKPAAGSGGPSGGSGSAAPVRGRCASGDPLCDDSEAPANPFATDAELAKCAGATKVKLVISCAAGKCTIKSATGADAKIRACFVARIAKLTAPAGSFEVALDLPK